MEVKVSMGRSPWRPWQLEHMDPAVKVTAQGLVVKISPSNAGGVGSIPGWGAKIPYASRPKNIKQEEYCNKFNKDKKKKGNSSTSFRLSVQVSKLGTG